jgi:arabinogalactan oligomer/maltooligosaccharide transport system substrate-binding protein
MKRTALVLVTLLVLVSMVLAACGQAPTPTPVPPAPTATKPAVTTAATATPVPPAPTATTAPKPVKLALWTKEAGADLDWVNAQVKAFNAKYPYITIEVTNQGVEDLRNNYQTASLAGTGPDFLWTVNDHIGVFAAAKLIQPAEDIFGKDYFKQFVQPGIDAALYQGKIWGVPISVGNHLMLLYNKKLLPNPPTDTDQMIKMAQDFMTANPGKYGLVYNLNEPFWVAPWLGAFGGWPLDESGTTVKATMNTPAMVDTMQFLHDLKFVQKIVPLEADYNGADTLFKEGKAAMIINGDWSLGGYLDVTTTKVVDLGVARIPKVVKTGQWPSPMTSGVYFLVNATTKGDKLDAVKLFVNWIEDKQQQVSFTKTLNRLPALTEASTDPVVSGNALLKGSFDQMSVGRPMPVVPEMRCAWDAIRPNLEAVMGDKAKPADAAKSMQSAADDCIAKLK